MTMRVIVIGAGGHAKVLIDTLQRLGRTIVGLTDRDSRLQGTRVLGVEIIGDDSAIEDFHRDDVELVNGVGSIGIPRDRRRIYEELAGQGYHFPAVVHPCAILGADVDLGSGAQIMAGAVVQPGAQIGENAIVNTKASVDHDCRISAHVHVAPGATLSGNVIVGAESMLGVGCAVRQGTAIGKRVVVGAGAVVVSDLADDLIVFGNPARERRR